MKDLSLIEIYGYFASKHILTIDRERKDIYYINPNMLCGNLLCCTCSQGCMSPNSWCIMLSSVAIHYFSGVGWLFVAKDIDIG